MAISIYLDGADLATMQQYAADPMIEGFTTNPSLMAKAGITDYQTFTKQVLSIVGTKPVSFEVLSDDFGEMETQALQLAALADNVWVKIPITNTLGDTSLRLIDRLQDLQINITAVMTTQQLVSLRRVSSKNHIVSIFCGRIMDTLRPPPVPKYLQSRLLWASAREIYNMVQAEEAGYDIITLNAELIAKLTLRTKTLAQYSLETVQQFNNDAKGITF